MQSILHPSKETVILVDAGIQKTKSGLDIPMSSNERSRPELGKVLAFGRGKKPCDFEVGDIIAFRKYMDNKIMIEDQEVNFISFKDVLCIVKKG